MVSSDYEVCNENFVRSQGAMLFKPEMPRLNTLWDLHERPKLKVYLPQNSFEYIFKVRSLETRGIGPIDGAA